MRLWLIVVVLACFNLNLWSQIPKQAPPPLFRVEVETVFATVSVTDQYGRYVTGLEKDDFEVFEDQVRQDVSHFSHKAAPVSVGLIFDISGSMGDNYNISKAKNAVTRFLNEGVDEDEYFLVTFNQRSRVVQTFTRSGSTVQNEVARQKPGGSTALYDAVYMGLDYVKRGTNEKKAIILITDGEDNSSRYPPSEVREFAKELSVQVYAIGLEGLLQYGGSVIQNIISITGGRSFRPTNFNSLDYYLGLIHAELRSQYVLGYSPGNRVHNGRWRHIRIKVNAPPGMPKLIIRAREGYYAPQE
jgi:Ca-activated chloride channel family protein